MKVTIHNDEDQNGKLLIVTHGNTKTDPVKPGADVTIELQDGENVVASFGKTQEEYDRIKESENDGDRNGSTEADRGPGRRVADDTSGPGMTNTGKLTTPPVNGPTSGSTGSNQ